MCNVEQLADCGDILSLARALFISEAQDSAWLSHCKVSLSSCGSFLAVGYKNRLCLLTTQWISSTDSNSYLISWSGTLPSDITSILTVTLCPLQTSSQNGPDWCCLIVGFLNGNVGFYTNTGHLLLLEKLDEKPVMKLSCYTGTYGTLPDDIHVFFQHCIYIIGGSSLFQTLRNAKAHLAKGVEGNYEVDSKSISIRKWIFSDQESISDAAVVGLELKNTYDHLLAASTYGGYDTWYRSVPPVNNLVAATGKAPYLGFHYALEGGITPPLQDVARAVANKIKSALPGWLGGSSESAVPNSEPLIKAEMLTMRNGVYDPQRNGTTVVLSQDRRLAAITDNLGRVAVLDINKGYLIRLFKGYRDAQCAFIQLFDTDSMKPQLSTIKDVRRAVFLIIYNPKKGLIDVRLMQRGSRVAVFTATKNGKLLYNTCGLVGAEKNYTHKKLNLPEFQCVLIDPDGKLKKFNIPFYYSLEGEHLQRSKDLHILRGIRDILKKGAIVDEDSEIEIIKNVSTLKTFECKKHCMDILVKNYELSRNLLVKCLEIFWDSYCSEDNSNIDQRIKNYFCTLVLLTLFYQNIHGDSTDDMKVVSMKVYQMFNINTEFDNEGHSTVAEASDLDFHLLEDDNCILERLLILAQEKEYKEYQHAKVTFADAQINNYKEFMSNFHLDEKTNLITLKPNINEDKLHNLASDIFKSILKLKNLNQITMFVKLSAIEPKDVVKLVISHVMSMPLEDFNIGLIEKLIEILYYICCATEQATCMCYNEISLWWEDIRTILMDMVCPLRSLILAMACKAVVKILEARMDKDDAWESVTAENAKWGILIGKLEDISILSIILIFKDSYNGNSWLKLHFDDININFKYIYTRGKGSVTELIAKWLCSMGVPPEAVSVHSLMEVIDSNSVETDNRNDDQMLYVFVENNKKCVDDNPKIFKWLSLLKRQFPLSTKSDYIVANMSWEYAVEWQKSMKHMQALEAVVHSLDHISDMHLRLGIFSIVWCTYIKQIFELSCRLVNKVGKLPKDHLCLQDLGFDSQCLQKFLEITTKFLDKFHKCSLCISTQEKSEIKFEKIWDESLPSLVEVAQDTANINSAALQLSFQIGCTIYYQCYFNLKFSKPLDSLYDEDYQNILDSVANNTQGEHFKKGILTEPSDKIVNSRMKYLTKLIRTSIETISCVNSEDQLEVYNDGECLKWIENITYLSSQWGIDDNFVRRQHVIGLFHMGYDSLAENILVLINEPATLLSPFVAITIQRLKKNLENSENQPEWIVSVPPQLYKRMQNTPFDTSVPSQLSIASTASILQKLLFQIDKKTENVTLVDKADLKLAKLIVDSCDILIRKKL